MSFFPGFRKSPLSERDRAIGRGYLDNFKNGISRAIPLRSATFTVLDTETTGLDYRKDKILSIAAIKVLDFSASVESRMEEFIYQEGYRPGEEVKIHGIMRNHVNDALPEKKVLEKLLDFAGNDVIVGHHIAFDIRMINEALKKNFGLKLKNIAIDTASLALKVDPSTKPLSLDNLCNKYGIIMGERHTAAADTFSTTILFLKLAAILERRGAKNLNDLL